MIGSDAIGLIFRLRAENEASGEVKKFRKDVEDLTKAADDSAQNGLTDFAQKLGLTAQQTAQLSSALPVVGAAIAGVATAAVAAGAGIALIGAELFNLTRQVAEAGTEIKNFQNLTGLTAASISTIKSASEAAGTSLEEFEEVWESFIEVLIEGGQGAEDAAEKLKKAGIEPQKGFKDLEGSVLKAFDAIRNANSQAEKSAIAMAVFGESGLNMVKVAGEMTGGFDAFKKKLIETGVAFDEEGVRKSKEYNQQLKELGAQFEGIKRIIAFEFMPVFSEMARDVGKFLKENKTDIKAWGEYTADILRGTISYWEKLLQAKKDYFDAPELKKTDPNAPGDPNKFNMGGASNPFNFLSGLLKPIEWLQQEGERVRRNAPKPIDYTRPQDKPIAPNLIDTEKQKEAAEKAAKEAEETAKKNINALLQMWRNYGAEVGKVFDDTFNKLKEDFEKTGDSEAFRTGFRNLVAYYYDEVNRTEEALKKLEAVQSDQQKKTTSERELLQQEQNKRQTDWIEKATKKEQEREKIITDSAKKAGEERVKNAETASARSLEVLQAEYAFREAQLNQRMANDRRKESDHVRDIQKIREDAIRDEIAAQEKLAANSDLSQDQRAEIANRIKVLKIELNTQLINSGIAVQEAVDKETKAFEDQKAALEKLREEIRQATENLTQFKKAQERKVLLNVLESAPNSRARVEAVRELREFDIQEELRRQAAIEAEIDRQREAALKEIDGRRKTVAEIEAIEEDFRKRRERAEAEHFNNLRGIRSGSNEAIQTAIPTSGISAIGEELNSALAGLLGEETKETLAAMKPLADGITQSFGAMAQAVGASVKSFVLFGGAGTSFRKFAAELLASIAQMAAVQAVWNLAEGFAKLALAYFFPAHPTAGLSATQHFIAAGIYGSIAGIAAIAGRATAGNEFKNETQGAYGSASAGGGVSTGNNRTPAEPGVFSQHRDEQVVDIARNAPIGERVAAAYHLTISNELPFGHWLRFELSRDGEAREAIRSVT